MYWLMWRNRAAKGYDLRGEFRRVTRMRVPKVDRINYTVWIVQMCTAMEEIT